MAKFRTGCVSITGNFRDNNEDSLFVDEDLRFFVVADGMGGQSAGEKASAIATELIPKKLKQLIDFENEPEGQIVDKIDKAVEHANAEIMALGEVEASYRNMGTTVVFAIQIGSKTWIGGVGDSRVYLYRDGQLKQLTTDHSLTQALLDAGTISEKEAATHRYRNMLYRYLGTKEGGTGTGAKSLKPQSGDRLLLCSDGVTDGAEDSVLSRLLSEHPDPQEAAELIVKAAQDGGSKDNITCVFLDSI